MLRTLLILGALAATSVLIPIVYQSNPRMLDGLLKPAAGAKSAVDAPTDLNLAAVPTDRQHRNRSAARSCSRRTSADISRRPSGSTAVRSMA
jgi:hypothetical protein